jgi:hypothetical protein
MDKVMHRMKFIRKENKAMEIKKTDGRITAKSNTIYFLTDHLDFGEFGCYGDGVLQRAPFSCFVVP